MRPTKLGFMRFGVLIITVLVAACTDNVPVDSGTATASPWFTDITNEAGLDFEH
jgi:hypothetical protein